jgi:hypothetical protein
MKANFVSEWMEKLGGCPETVRNPRPSRPSLVEGSKIIRTSMESGRFKLAAANRVTTGKGKGAWESLRIIAAKWGDQSRTFLGSDQVPKSP